VALPATYGLGRFVVSQLYGVAPHDVGVTISAIAMLGIVAILAACVPVRRAIKIDPMEALRHE
jgi:ABC-type antimicrobial peptide transport system permease subunit